MIRVKRLKYKGHDTKVEISYEREHNGRIGEFSLKCLDAPKPSLEAALNRLVDSACEICELPSSWNADMSVISVSFSYSDTVRSAAVTARKRLEDYRAHIEIKTPMLPDVTEDGSPEFPHPHLLDAVHEEALAYIRGERAQADMFVEEREQTEEPVGTTA